MNQIKDRGPSWINHAGKRIFFVDYSSLSGQELVDLVKKARAEIIEAIEKGEKGFYSLADVTDAILEREAINLFREAGIVMAGSVEASAVVGIHGIKKHVLRFVNILAPIKTQAFDTIEEAKEWIAKL